MIDRFGNAQILTQPHQAADTRARSMKPSWTGQTACRVRRPCSSSKVMSGRIWPRIAMRSSSSGSPFFGKMMAARAYSAGDDLRLGLGRQHRADLHQGDGGGRLRHFVAALIDIAPAQQHRLVVF